MPTTVKFRRGTTTQNDAFTGAAGELTVDETLDTVVVHDGSTAGGFPLINEAATQTMSNKTLTSPTLTSAVLNTAVSGTAVLDEDDMSSNSATQLATQQSIKAYVDSQVTAQDLDITTDSGTIAIDLDSETLTVTGGTGIDSSATGNAVTVAIDSTVATLTGSQTLQNKTLSSPTINGATITGHLVPDTDSDGDTGYDLGSSLYKFRDLYLSGTSLNLGSATITASGSSIVLPSGTTVSGGSGAAVDLNSTQTLTNKTIDSASNTLTLDMGEGTLTGTLAEFGTACQDDTIAGIAATQTLTNKTVDLGNNTVTGTLAEFNSAMQDGSFVSLAGTETLTNKTLTSPNITSPSITGTGSVAASTVNATTLQIGGVSVTSTAAELNKLDGYTGSVTELNYLDTLHATGVTSTEFDYLDGVSSNIQTQLDAKLAKSGGTMTGKITLDGDPTAANHAATKSYVDTIAAAGLHYHDPVRGEVETNFAATYSNGSSGVGATLTATSNGAFNLGGISDWATSDRVLIYNQTTAAQNGVYTVTTVGDGSTAAVLTRATDADSYSPSDPDAFGQGDAFYVQEGAGAGELYVMTTSGTITFGTTNITFSQISSAQIYSGGTDITLDGTTFNLNGTISANTTGSAATLTTARTISIAGDATGSTTFDGSANKSISISLAADSVAANEIAANAVGASELNVTGNGTSGQYLASDGDGTMTWTTLPAGYGDSDVDAHLSGGSGITYSSGAISITSGSVTAAMLAANSVDSSELVDNSVDASHLNVTGNGTTSQFLRSDGDGSFTWATPTDTNTTYSAGAGLDLSGTTFSIESDLRGDVYYIGRDTNDYYLVNTTVHDWRLDGNLDMRLENDGDLHVDGNVIAHSGTTSDERLKTGITVINDALEKVSSLRGVEFTYKADGRRSAGLIAQEVEKVLPQAITEKQLPTAKWDDNETEYKVLEYAQVTGLLVEAIKELKAEIEELKKNK